MLSRRSKAILIQFGISTTILIAMIFTSTNFEKKFCSFFTIMFFYYISQNQINCIYKWPSENSYSKSIEIIHWITYGEQWFIVFSLLIHYIKTCFDFNEIFSIIFAFVALYGISRGTDFVTLVKDQWRKSVEEMTRMNKCCCKCHHGKN
ncbi:hypothetical protein PVAND_001365 [Polypedilum vanderplanki]|uniref:Uncharacterized protein n=1 Tax=Polypedilum vanderplanki TaxID=319348 RepID=A0A9J6BN59_POLVA|nr:hypothetical protein PVAND_001365 [Polypedilum vanderplanki]